MKTRNVRPRRNGHEGVVQRFGTSCSKFFSHAEYGGPEGSLVCAMAWRDMMLALFDAQSHEAWRRSRRQTPLSPPRKEERRKLGAMRNIHRNSGDDRRSAGWAVLLRRGNRKWTRFFSDSIHGGMRRALAAAKVWRDEKTDSVWTAGYPVWKRDLLRSDNSSGVPGVSRWTHRMKVAKRLKESPAWRARWTDLDGKEHSRTFYISAYGDDQAFELAVRTRREAMEALAEEAQRRERRPGVSSHEGEL